MNEFRRCLVDMDVAAVKALWPVVSPNSPLIRDDEEALSVIHYARTQAESIHKIARLYSHKWLRERGLPSGLPDGLRASAERVYPIAVEAVGVSVRALSAASAPLAKAIEQAMSDAVAEAYADGRCEPEFVKARMEEARARAMKC